MMPEVCDSFFLYTILMRKINTCFIGAWSYQHDMDRTRKVMLAGRVSCAKKEEKKKKKMKKNKSD